MTIRKTFKTYEEGYFKTPSFVAGYCHIYIAYDKEGRVCYVGRTNNLFTRIMTHLRKSKIRHVRYKYIIVKEEDMEMAEQYYIEKEQPYTNIQGKIPKVKEIGDFKPNKPVTNLAEYLYELRMSVTDFADIMGYNRTTITGYLNGKLRLGVKAAMIIEKITKGIVTMEMILSKNPSKNIWHQPKETEVIIKRETGQVQYLMDFNNNLIRDKKGKFIKVKPDKRKKK